jgi:hypothetical protein
MYTDRRVIAQGMVEVKDETMGERDAVEVVKERIEMSRTCRKYNIEHQRYTQGWKDLFHGEWINVLQ